MVQPPVYLTNTQKKNMNTKIPDIQKKTKKKLKNCKFE